MRECKHGIPAFGYCNQCFREKFHFDNLKKKEEIINASYAMVLSHGAYETMYPAVESVSKIFPDIPRSFLTAMWVGINAKQNDMEIESMISSRSDNNVFGTKD